MAIHFFMFVFILMLSISLYLKEEHAMNDLQKVLEKAATLSTEIDYLLKMATYNEYEDLSGLKIDYKDPEQLLLLDELRLIMEKLDEANRRIEYLNKPVKYKGKLCRNNSGKYELENGHHYSCGSVIEVFISDDWHDAPYWARSRVEHDGKDYYLVGHKDMSLEGLPARIRG